MTHRTVEGSPESGSRITPDAPASPAPPQGERHTRTLMELLACCEAWEPDVRILGNVSAEDAADAIRASLRASPEVPVAQDERECRKTCDICWDESGSEWPCAKAAGRKRRAALSAATPPAAVPEMTMGEPDERGYAIFSPAAVPMSQKTQDGHSTSRSGEAPTTPLPEGWRWILVDGGSFDALVRALNRAESKGYMPNAMADEWQALNWQEAHEVEQMNAASRRSAAEAQKPNEHESGAAMGTQPADKTWTAHEDCGMRHPEACDLMGGETDASIPPADKENDREYRDAISNAITESLMELAGMDKSIEEIRDKFGLRKQPGIEPQPLGGWPPGVDDAAKGKE